MRWTLVRGKLPRGIRLDARTGTLIGTARMPGKHRITVTAADSLGVKATQTFVLVVR